MMNVRELKELLNDYPDETVVGVYSYYDNISCELLELADGIQEGITDDDHPVIYIF